MKRIPLQISLRAMPDAELHRSRVGSSFLNVGGINAAASDNMALSNYWPIRIERAESPLQLFRLNHMISSPPWDSGLAIGTGKYFLDTASPGGALRFPSVARVRHFSQFVGGGDQLTDFQPYFLREFMCSAIHNSLCRENRVLFRFERLLVFSDVPGILVNDNVMLLYGIEVNVIKTKEKNLWFLRLKPRTRLLRCASALELLARDDRPPEGMNDIFAPGTPYLHVGAGRARIFQRFRNDMSIDDLVPYGKRFDGTIPTIAEYFNEKWGIILDPDQPFMEFQCGTIVPAQVVHPLDSARFHEISTLAPFVPSNVGTLGRSALETISQCPMIRGLGLIVGSQPVPFDVVDLPESANANFSMPDLRGRGSDSQIDKKKKEAILAVSTRIKERLESFNVKHVFVVCADEDSAVALGKSINAHASLTSPEELEDLLSSLGEDAKEAVVFVACPPHMSQSTNFLSLLYECEFRAFKYGTFVMRVNVCAPRTFAKGAGPPPMEFFASTASLVENSLRLRFRSLQLPSLSNFMPADYGSSPVVFFSYDVSHATDRIDIPSVVASVAICIDTASGTVTTSSDYDLVRPGKETIDHDYLLKTSRMLFDKVTRDVEKGPSPPVLVFMRDGWLHQEEHDAIAKLSEELEKEDLAKFGFATTVLKKTGEIFTSTCGEKEIPRKFSGGQLFTHELYPDNVVCIQAHSSKFGIPRSLRFKVYNVLPRLDIDLPEFLHALCVTLSHPPSKSRIPFPIRCAHNLSISVHRRLVYLLWKHSKKAERRYFPASLPEDATLPAVTDQGEKAEAVQPDVFTQELTLECVPAPAVQEAPWQREFWHELTMSDDTKDMLWYMPASNGFQEKPFYVMDPEARLVEARQLVDSEKGKLSIMTVRHLDAILDNWAKTLELIRNQCSGELVVVSDENNAAVLEIQSQLLKQKRHLAAVLPLRNLSIDLRNFLKAHNDYVTWSIRTIATILGQRIPSQKTKRAKGTFRKELDAQCTLLNVPFADKDKAKALGARWNSAKLQWVAPAGADLDLFEQWIPKAASDASGSAVGDIPSNGFTKLIVPFHHKDEAKALGARWNPELSSWVIPAYLDAAPFAKWLHTPHVPAAEENISASSSDRVLQQTEDEDALPEVPMKAFKKPQRIVTADGIVILNVRFDEKEHVKSLGAVFNRDYKTWCVPPGMSLAPFARWVVDANLIKILTRL